MAMADCNGPAVPRTVMARPIDGENPVKGLPRTTSSHPG